MSSENNLQESELSAVMVSFQNWTLKDKQKEVLEKRLDDIISGFRVPYVRVLFRRRLRETLNWVLNDRSLWKIQPSDDLLSKCNEASNILTDTFINSKSCVDRETRARIVDVMVEVKRFV